MANNQVLTVSLPGQIIDWKYVVIILARLKGLPRSVEGHFTDSDHREYYYNSAKHVRAPLDVHVKEARLVDGMIPLSKYTVSERQSKLPWLPSLTELDS